MRGYRHMVGSLTIVRFYENEDKFWNLPEDKKLRQLIADVQRDLTIEADRLVQIPYQVRG